MEALIIAILLSMLVLSALKSCDSFADAAANADESEA